VNTTAEIILGAVLVFGGMAAIAAAAVAVWLSVQNAVTVLAIRRHCHGTFQHPAKAHAGEGDKGRAAEHVPPLYRQLLTFPPMRWPWPH
jgi:hypothetical protein